MAPSIRESGFLDQLMEKGLLFTKMVMCILEIFGRIELLASAGFQMQIKAISISVRGEKIEGMGGVDTKMRKEIYFGVNLLETQNGALEK